MTMEMGRDMTKFVPLNERKAWKALEAHHKTMETATLKEMFASDPARGERLTAEAGGVFLDYSKNRVTDETLKLLIELAVESGVKERAEAMFTGREDQHHGGAECAACGAAGSEVGEDLF